MLKCLSFALQAATISSSRAGEDSTLGLHITSPSLGMHHCIILGETYCNSKTNLKYAATWIQSKTNSFNLKEQQFGTFSFMSFQKHVPFPEKLKLLRSSSAQATLPHYASHFSAHMNPPVQPGRGQAPDALNAAFCFLMLRFTTKNKPAQNNPLVYRYCASYLFHHLNPSSVLQKQLHLEKEWFMRLSSAREN